MKEKLVFSILLIVLTQAVASGKIISLSLREMVDESELIVVGKVVRAEKTAVKHHEYGEEYKAIIEPRELAKGTASNSLEVHYFPSLSTEPEISVNKTAVFFLKRRAGAYTCVQGYGGVVDIKDGEVFPSYIAGEKNQTLKGFIQKIRAIAK